MNIKLFSKIISFSLLSFLGIANAAEPAWFTKDLNKMSAYFKLIKNSTNKTLSVVQPYTNKIITLVPGQSLKNVKIDLESLGSYKLGYFEIKNNNNQVLGHLGLRLASRADYNLMNPELTRALKDRLSAFLIIENTAVEDHWAQEYDTSKDEKVAVGIIINFKGENLQDTEFDVVAAALAQE